MPQAWLEYVNDSHQYMKSMQSVLEEHLRLSPRRWGGAGLATMCWDEVRAAVLHWQAVARANEDDVSKCDGCRKESLAIKRCSACRQAKYCRWV